ncbi:MAG: xanthine dehydrogenase family protein molybdopterin-binding subunit [Pseudomonadota bacterium]
MTTHLTPRNPKLTAEHDVATPGGPASAGSPTIADSMAAAFAAKHAAAPSAAILANPNRRTVLQGAASIGGGLLIGLQLPGKARAESGAAAVIKGNGTAGTFAPNAFVRIAPDSTVTVLIKHIEFGQGTYTGLSTLVADELDADWAQMRAEHAPANDALYKNFAFGLQGTGGSTAIANAHEQMRKAGAAAKAMLVEAAATAWGVPAGEITVSKGQLKHPGSGKVGTFGEFADAAAALTPPSDVKLKTPDQFTLIGTDVPKLDTKSKTTGTATFTLDVVRDGMLTVLLARPPRFGAKPKSVDDTEALKVNGVVDVKTLPRGIAVYAKDFWAAKKGRDALVIEWANEGTEARSSAQLIAEYREKAKSPGLIARNDGDVAGTLDKADRKVEAEYVFPFLAHAPMEPLDYVIEKSQDGKIEVWGGAQFPTADQGAIAQILGVRPEDVTVNTMLAGGSFGRRATPVADIASEAATAFKARGTEPLKIVWTREDDIQNGYYRPLTVHRLAASLDGDGNITAWDETIATQSIVKGTAFEMMMKDGIDPTTVEGAKDLPYNIPNTRVSVHNMEAGIPPLWWRAVGHTHTAYATEVFLDELLEATGKDPVQARLDMLGDKHPRLTGVLTAAAKAADWGSPMPEGRARGVSLHKSFNSYVAQIAEVSEGDEAGIPKVHKMWCAIDCGLAVNPNVIKAQMEGGLGYGLGHALYGEINIDNGTVTEANFDSYRSLRINEMPDVEVVIVPSDEAPTGVGEPATPPAPAAVANAWATLTGKRVRQLPFSRTGDA